MRVLDRAGLGPRGLWRRYVIDVARTSDAESDAYRATVSGEEANRVVAIVLVTSAIALSVINFYAKDWTWLPALVGRLGFGVAEARLFDAFTTDPAWQFNGLALWTGVQLVAYVAMPLVAIRFMRMKVGDFGLRWRGIGAHWKVYALLLAVSVPVVVWVSASEAFLVRYPFLDLAPGERLWPYMTAWWVLYALQFVALEFFFRGFMVHGLKWRMGYAAVFVMIVPYNMIHFSKPFLEAMGAIVGGVTLGTLSLKTRSVWWGALLHIAVAATMDGMALFHKGVIG